MNNYNTTSNVVTTDTSDYDDIFTSTEESPSTLLHRLHTNERQLRTLAVVLSLTGGLALSFALGVGILIYWYSRKCKERRRLLSHQDKENDEESNSSSLHCPSCHPQIEPSIKSIANETRQIQAIASTSSQALLDSLPPPPLTAPTPIPSAPTEKEIHMAIRHDHEALCHECQNPPPAYTED